jgi:hypothetical protein
MRIYNGVSLIPSSIWLPPGTILHTDACLTGGGGFSNGKYFHFKFNSNILETLDNINSLELYVVLIAVRTWGKQLENKNFNIFSDNSTTVYNVNSGRSDSEISQSILREIRYHCAVNEFQIRCKHVAGKDNQIADCLSRWHLDAKYSSEFFELTKNYKLHEFVITNQEINDFW